MALSVAVTRGSAWTAGAAGGTTGWARAPPYDAEMPPHPGRRAAARALPRRALRPDPRSRRGHRAAVRRRSTTRRSPRWTRRTRTTWSGWSSHARRTAPPATPRPARRWTAGSRTGRWSSMPWPASTSTSRRVGGLVRLRGLIGALGLHDPADQVVLPHEDVMPWPVEDRAALQQALEAHVEPIWLVYDGGGRRVRGRRRCGRQRPAASTPRRSDGVRHRLWAITDAAELDGRASRPGGAAGPHRRRPPPLRGLPPGADSPPRRGCRSRTVGLRARPARRPPHPCARGRCDPPCGARCRAGRRGTGRCGTGRCGRGRRVADGAGPARAGFDAAGGCRGRRCRGSTLPEGEARTAAFAGTPGETEPGRWQALDTALLHEVLLPAWGVAEDAVSYHHDAAGAVRAAARDGGVAVLLAPVDVADVLALAADGVRMPRKSTSFGPKPRSGFVLRTFAGG